MPARLLLRSLAPAVLATLLVCVAAAGATPTESARPARTSPPFLVWSTSKMVEETPGHSVQRHTLWLASADGSRPRILTEGSFPLISPDGRWVTFTRDDGVYAMRTTGGRPWLFAPEAALFGEWSSDSRYINTSAGEVLHVADITTRRSVTIDRGARVYGASLSPSGKEIIWGRKRGSVYEGPVDLFRANVDGSGKIRVTRDGRSTAPLWGPRRIAFARVRKSGDVHFPIYELWTMRADGSGARRMLRGSHIPVAWSADGRRLLTSTVTNNGSSISAVDVRTGKARVLVRGKRAFALTLSRDGRFALVWLGGNLIRVTWDGRKRTILARNVDEFADWNL